MIKGRNIAVNAILMGVFYLAILGAANSLAAINVPEIINNMEKNDKQSVLVGQIDSLTIKRGVAEWRLGPGELTLFDFGTGRTLAMVFNGKGRFVYTPPDEMERGQLKKFTGKDSLAEEYLNPCIFFAPQIGTTLDTTVLRRTPIDQISWKGIQEVQQTAFEYLRLYMPNMIMATLETTGNCGFFYSNFELPGIGKFVVCENPATEDKFRLYKLSESGNMKVADIVGGISDTVVCQSPIDITNYKIGAKINIDGKIQGSCKIEFVATSNPNQFINFAWSSKNTIKKIKDSKGKPIFSVSKEGLAGFGLALNKNIQPGQSDYITIEYAGQPFIMDWDIIYCDTINSWYPQNLYSDKAAFDISIKYPSNYRFVAGDMYLKPYEENYNGNAKWKVIQEKTNIWFCLGGMNISESPAKSELFIHMLSPNKIGWGIDSNQPEISRSYLVKGILNIISSDIWSDSAFGETNSDLAFFRRLTEIVPADTVFTVEVPFVHGKGVDKIIQLSSFMKGSFRDRDRLIRAHEIAHLWWGNCIRPETYHDEWITEGLAEYCAYLANRNLPADKGRNDTLTYLWQRNILAAKDSGPVVMGKRLNSSISNDYDKIIKDKSAYIFHMIRFLLKDYKSKTDTTFAAFLGEMATKYKDNSINTQELQALLEKYTGKDMTWFFDQWVYGTDIPTYNFTYKSNKTPEGNYQVTCHVIQSDVPAGFKMQVPITVVYGSGTMSHYLFTIDKVEQDIALPLLMAEPQKVIFNTFDAVLCNLQTK